MILRGLLSRRTVWSSVSAVLSVHLQCSLACLTFLLLHKEYKVKFLAGRAGLTQEELTVFGVCLLVHIAKRHFLLKVHLYCRYI